MYYTVYKITNKTSGKIYIGCHKTSNLDDGYMGSGTYLKRAQEKYGIENFEKEILEVFESSETMFNMEAKLVNADFVANENNYNLKEGGCGGWDHITSEHHKGSVKRKASQSINIKKATEALQWLYKNNPEWLENRNKVFIESIIKFYEQGGVNGFGGKTHSEETKRKIGEKSSIRESGKGNSQFGTMWIYSLTEKRNLKIKKDELKQYEKMGWLKGRKMKFL